MNSTLRTLSASLCTTLLIACGGGGGGGSPETGAATNTNGYINPANIQGRVNNQGTLIAEAVPGTNLINVSAKFFGTFGAHNGAAYALDEVLIKDRCEINELGPRDRIFTDIVNYDFNAGEVLVITGNSGTVGNLTPEEDDSYSTQLDLPEGTRPSDLEVSLPPGKPYYYADFPTAKFPVVEKFDPVNSIETRGTAWYRNSKLSWETSTNINSHVVLEFSITDGPNVICELMDDGQFNGFSDEFNAELDAYIGNARWSGTIRSATREVAEFMYLEESLLKVVSRRTTSWD